jgi:2-oxoisovalerate dehydrogenase E1 component
MNDARARQILQDFILTRAIEEKMLIYLRQGKISKWFASYGQEALSVAAAHSLSKDEFMCTMHRNLGAFVAREVPLKRLFAQFQGKAEGFTKGRDRSFHFGSMEHHIVGMISHLGAQLGVACGLALREKLQETGKCVLAFTGDGATSQGDFHEALNVAAVWSLPVVFVVERNYWGLSTPEHQQFNFQSFEQKGPAYGMKTMSFNANDLKEATDHFASAAEYARSEGKPILLEAITFRLRGHEEASGTKYYPEGMIAEMEKKEPMTLLRAHSQGWGVTEAWIDEELVRAKKMVDKAFHVALELPDLEYDRTASLEDVYASSTALASSANGSRALRFIDAIHDALGEAMRKWPELVLMGQDIADYGGVFKATEGYTEEFGEARVRNTPLCESAIVGTAMGYAIAGGKAMMEMQFADFVTTGFNQIVNNLAKLHWRWGQHVDVVVRMPTGAGVAAGPYHSQSTEAWFTHVPGLKVVYPAYPAEAKALLLASFNDPNPVMFFEHKALYRTVKEEVPAGITYLDLGKAHVQHAGSDLTIITYGMGVHWAMDLAKRSDANIEVVNLRTLVPLDFETIQNSIAKTNRVVVLQEDIAVGGYGEHIASRIARECFELLDAPVELVSSDATPIPFAAGLEKGFLASARLEEVVNRTVKY